MDEALSHDFVARLGTPPPSSDTVQQVMEHQDDQPVGKNSQFLIQIDLRTSATAPQKWGIIPESCPQALLTVISVNQIGKPPQSPAPSKSYKPKSANQECNSGINPQSSQESRTEEPPRIENVGHGATNYPIFPSQVAKANRFHKLLPQRSTWNTVRVSELCCELCLGSCRSRYAPALQSGLRTSQTFQGETSSSSSHRQFRLVFVELDATGVSHRCFQVDDVVPWARDQRRQLCRQLGIGLSQIRISQF